MNSRIILAKGINMDRDYNNVLSYSESDMLTLLRSQAHLVREASNYSFIRGTGQLDTQFTYAECLGANYIAFQNPDYSNKWFFAWIDEVQYRGNYNTRIIYTIDAWSTWFSDWTAKKCFVNRHHVNDDTIGANRVPENLAINDIIQLDEGSITDLGTNYYVAMQTSWILNDNSTGNITDLNKGTQFSGITVYNKQIYGRQIILFGPFNGTNTDFDKYKSISFYLGRCNNDGHINDVENIFIVPSALIDTTKLEPHYAELFDDTKPINFYTILYTYEPKEINVQFPKEYEFTDYTPKNNKCYCYPINYLYVTNNNGNSNIFKYEDFYNSQVCTFKIWLAMSIGVSAKLFPTNYKYQTNGDFDNGLPLGKYPVCGWSSDAFTNWLTSQAVNIATSFIPSVSAKDANEETNTLTGADIGLGIARKTAQIIGTLYTGSLMPNIEGGNNNTADVLWSGNKNNIIFRKMRASLHDLQIMDDYFTRFGYAIKKLEMPNITGRRYWNYVEIGSTEEIGYGTVPQNFMDKINNACRKGVTIWHSHDNIGNWDLNNEIINE